MALLPALAVALVVLPAPVGLALRHADATPVSPGNAAVSTSIGVQGEAGILLPVRLRLGVADRLDLGLGAYYQAAEGENLLMLIPGAPLGMPPPSVALHLEASGTAGLVRIGSGWISARVLVDRGFDVRPPHWKLAGGLVASASAGAFVFELAALADVFFRDPSDGNTEPLLQVGMTQVFPEAAVRASWILGRVAPSLALEMDSTPGPYVDPGNITGSFDVRSRVLAGPGLAAYFGEHVRMNLDLRIGRDALGPEQFTAAGLLGLRVDIGS